MACPFLQLTDRSAMNKWNYERKSNNRDTMKQKMSNLPINRTGEVVCGRD